MRNDFSKEKLEYWLNSIKLKAPDSTVLIVATRLDQISVQIPEKLSNQFCILKGCIQVSCTEMTNIDILRNKLVQLTKTQMIELNPEEQKFLQAIKDEKLKKKPWIEGKLTELAPPELLQEGNMAKIQQALKKFHNMGAILYYAEVPALQSFIVLDPNWLINLAKSIINVKNSKHVLTRTYSTKSDLAEVTNQQYHSLAELLVHLGLVIPVEMNLTVREIKYVVPCLLAQCPDEIAEQYNKAKVLQYRFKFFPKDLFPLVVGCLDIQKYIQKSKDQLNCWENAMVLENEGETVFVFLKRQYQATPTITLCTQHPNSSLTEKLVHVIENVVHTNWRGISFSRHLYCLRCKKHSFNKVYLERNKDEIITCYKCLHKSPAGDILQGESVVINSVTSGLTVKNKEKFQEAFLRFWNWQKTTSPLLYVVEGNNIIFGCEYPGEWHLVRNSTQKLKNSKEFIEKHKNYISIMNESLRICTVCPIDPCTIQEPMFNSQPADDLVSWVETKNKTSPWENLSAVNDQTYGRKLWMCTEHALRKQPQLFQASNCHIGTLYHYVSLKNTQQFQNVDIKTLEPMASSLHHNLVKSVCSQSSLRLNKVEIIVNPALIDQYLEAIQSIADFKEILAFNTDHKSDAAEIASICKTGYSCSTQNPLVFAQFVSADAFAKKKEISLVVSKLLVQPHNETETGTFPQYEMDSSACILPSYVISAELEEQKMGKTLLFVSTDSIGEFIGNAPANRYAIVKDILLLETKHSQFLKRVDERIQRYR